MKTTAFALRNNKELLRDPLNIVFSMGFPLAILFLLSLIQSNIPVSLFEIENLTPGIAVFGLSFIALFSSTLIAKDRTSSFLTRLFASPLTSTNYILGYTLPLLPMAIAQSAVCFFAAFFLKLPINFNVIIALITLIPTAILFISIGLLAGSVLNDKQVGGVCGALLTNLSAWLSGTWFDLNLVGGWFKIIADALPFVHAVNATRAALAGNYSQIFPDLYWVIAYAAIVTFIAIFAFNQKMHQE